MIMKTSSQEAQKYLARVPFFSDLSEEGKSLLREALKISLFTKGTFVKSENEKLLHLPIILSGTVRVFKASPSGRTLTLYRLQEGDTCLLAAYCILSNTTYPAEAIIDQDSKMALISAETFKDLYAIEKSVQEFVVNLGLHRIMKLIMVIEEIAFNKLDKRLALFLIEKAMEKGSKNSSMQMTHQQIADELGTAREVISRLLHDFESHEFVFLARKQIEIRNLAALEKIAHDFHP